MEHYLTDCLSAGHTWEFIIDREERRLIAFVSKSNWYNFKAVTSFRTYKVSLMGKGGEASANDLDDFRDILESVGANFYDIENFVLPEASKEYAGIMIRRLDYMGITGPDIDWEDYVGDKNCLIVGAGKDDLRFNFNYLGIYNLLVNEKDKPFYQEDGDMFEFVIVDGTPLFCYRVVQFFNRYACVCMNLDGEIFNIDVNPKEY